MEKEKQWFFKNQSALKLMKYLNAQENVDIIKNQNEYNNTMIKGRLSQQEFKRNEREQFIIKYNINDDKLAEQQRSTNQREQVLIKLDIEKQKLKKALGQKFQKRKEIDPMEISSNTNFNFVQSVLIIFVGTESSGPYA